MSGLKIRNEKRMKNENRMLCCSNIPGGKKAKLFPAIKRFQSSNNIFPNKNQCNSMTNSEFKFSSILENKISLHV